MKLSSLIQLATGLIVLPGLLATCGENPTGTSQPGLFLATVAGHFEEEYRGTGSFVGPCDGRGLPCKQTGFGINSNSSDRSKRIGFARLVGELPRIGRHEIIRQGEAHHNSPNKIFAAYGTQTADDWVEYYASLEGEIIVTRSRRDVIEGSFWFTAFQYCRITSVEAPGSFCHSPIEFNAASPRITVTGTFRAYRDTGSVDPGALTVTRQRRKT